MKKLLLILSLALLCAPLLAQQKKAAAAAEEEEDKTPPMNLGIEMVFVRGNTYQMGCTKEQVSFCDGDEKPAHRVRINSFFIGKYEVTQEQWKAVMGDSLNPATFEGRRLPVETVSYVEVKDFIKQLNEKTGQKYRLPTEAEWEYAARGGRYAHDKVFSGSDTLEEVAWYVENVGESNHAVGLNKPNELGIYDMSGNVAEWCSDWYGSYLTNNVNPKGPSSGEFRVYRGGGGASESNDCRVSARSQLAPDEKDYNLGFRLVVSAQ
ncbi:MAG: formylglycine-generating enzyme family protein [Prevotellaceae bacterium]|jgi:formylglycine-generating enzyme required for sulfatase activity|nr:formylglycine-generating enzyme family protein [Prevotellaceae bacterium]